MVKSNYFLDSPVCFILIILLLRHTAILTKPLTGATFYNVLLEA